MQQKKPRFSGFLLHRWIPKEARPFLTVIKKGIHLESPFPWNLIYNPKKNKSVFNKYAAADIELTLPSKLQHRGASYDHFWLNLTLKNEYLLKTLLFKRIRAGNILRHESNTFNIDFLFIDLDSSTTSRTTHVRSLMKENPFSFISAFTSPLHLRPTGRRCLLQQLVFSPVVAPISTKHLHHLNNI